MRALLAIPAAALALATICCSNSVPPSENGGEATAADEAETGDAEPSEERMNALAERYVRLVLAVGEHDPAYVDAYYGPADWRQEVEAAKPDLATLRADATAAVAELEAAPPAAAADELERLRHTFLHRQLGALIGRVRMLQGERFTFDEESALLYDAVAPRHELEDFAPVQVELAALLPGEGPLAERYEAFRSRFYVPRERLPAVFDAAIAECRARTARHVELPPGESFTVEYVTGQPWSAYNWYQGGYRSVIQVNTDLPVAIDRAIDLACHEGYPGHHVYNSLLEQRLMRQRGWVEVSAYPLFSPMSLIAEGTANFGIEVAFPGSERVAWEREHLFSLAGLDPAQAADYYRVMALVQRLDYAGNEVARRYLDGGLDAAAAARALHSVALTSPLARAEQRVRFFDRYRSYVINYNLGQDLVRAWVERQGGTTENPQRRWEVFASLLASPRLPGGLVEGGGPARLPAAPVVGAGVGATR